MCFFTSMTRSAFARKGRILVFTCANQRLTLGTLLLSLSFCIQEWMDPNVLPKFPPTVRVYPNKEHKD